LSESWEIKGELRKAISRRPLPTLWQHRHVLVDPYDGFRTHVLMRVPVPSLESPYPCLLVSIATGNKRVTFRTNVISYLEAFCLSSELVDAASAAMASAQTYANQLEQANRVLFEARQLLTRR